MTPLPDDALVVRGGQNLPASFAQGSGVVVGADDKVQDVSVNSAPGLTLAQLTAGDLGTGYPGIPHNQIGITTVGAIRAAGGDALPRQTRTNPNHAVIGGITAKEASRLFRPTVRNPHRPRTSG